MTTKDARLDCRRIMTERVIHGGVPPEKCPSELPTAKQSNMRLFVLERSEDATGTSGEGVVAEGVEYSNGQVAIHWLSQLEAVSIYANVRVVETLHGHDGQTKIRWL